MVDPNLGMAAGTLRRAVEDVGVVAAQFMPAGVVPAVPINDKKIYPIYGQVRGARHPDLLLRRRARAARAVRRSVRRPHRRGVLVLPRAEVRHPPRLRAVGRPRRQAAAQVAEPLLLDQRSRPKYYPKAIVDFANTRGADKVMYAGYFPMGLSLDRIFKELPSVPFKDDVWPKFLRHNGCSSSAADHRRALVELLFDAQVIWTRGRSPGLAGSVRALHAAWGPLRDHVGGPARARLRARRPVIGVARVGGGHRSTEDGGELPGQWPYTRGPYASMYRSRLWTMRQFAGFGTAEDTNRRFKELLASGGNGLSTAFDMPTLLGRDSDDPLAKGEVGPGRGRHRHPGRHGDALRGIDLGAVSTSMTINSAAPVVMAMYIGVADRTGVERAGAGRHHPERHLEGVPGAEGVRLPAAAQRPPGHRPDPLRHRGAPPVAPGLRSRATTSARRARPPPRSSPSPSPTGSPTWRRRWRRASRRRLRPAPQLLLQRPHRLLRRDRQVPRRPADLGALDAGPLRRDRRRARSQLRFHTQTAGVSLTAQQPEVNLARVAIEALAGVLGGTQSLHTDSYDEALALPTEKAARLALRTQQVIAEETGVAHVADPLGGSWFVESLTDELERQAEAIFAHLERSGSGSMLDGVVACIEDGWFGAEIADAAYQFQSKIAKGDWIQVGVNGYTEGDDEQTPTLYVDPAVEEPPAAPSWPRSSSAATTTRCAGRSPGCGPRRPTRPST